MDYVLVGAGPVGQPLLDIITAVRLAPRSIFAPGGVAVRLMAHVQERQLDWLPLRQAVFKFGMFQSSDASRSAAQGSLEAETGDNVAIPSVEELGRLLGEGAGADSVSIDPIECAFLFDFHTGDGVAKMWGRPWVILEQNLAENIVPNSSALSMQHDAVCRATGLVWNQVMLRAFDRVVSTEQILFCARIGSTSAPFSQFEADVWPILTVLDWQNGMASHPQGMPYYSIHAASAGGFEKPEDETSSKDQTSEFDCEVGRARRANETNRQELIDKLRWIKVEATRLGAKFPMSYGKTRDTAEAIAKSPRRTFSHETIRKILSGRYSPAIRLAKNNATDPWWLGPTRGKIG